MIADPLKPGDLLRRERPTGILLLEEPCVVPLVHAVWIRHELAVLMEREPDERDDVGENALSGAVHLRAVERFVSGPELCGCPLVRRSADRVRELLDLLEREPLSVRAALEDLERGDLVFMLFDEAFE
jgi:hypothetical protein